MPELPEVETVRRGLAPVMEGARFIEVEARRGDLRWPLPKDFAKRIEGHSVSGLGRRAKYLLADLSSGEVLLMHLGMSGSFHVLNGGDAMPGNYYHERGKLSAHDHIVFHMSNGATITFNDPRRFGCMKLVAREKLDEEPLLRALGPEPLGNAFDAAIRRAERPRRAAGRGHPGGAQRRHQGRRLVLARPPPDRRRARHVPAQFPRLRPRRREMRHARLQGHGQAHRADRAVDVLLSGVPEVIS